MKDNLRGIFYIALKDMKTYYLKPPAISWGIIFPLTWILAFYLRNPSDFKELIPGLIAMTILFSTTAAEAVVINFELRIGTLERLLLAPVDVGAILFGKILGGVIFGFLMSFIITAISIIWFNLNPDFLSLVLIIISSLFVFSSLGALLGLLVREIFEAQTLLNLPRFIMIFLSGVVYPVWKLPLYLQYVAYVLPLTYTVEGLRLSFMNISKFLVFQYFLILTCFLFLFLLPAINFLYKKFE